jgi:membrane associated rhomboid family serine protease
VLSVGASASVFGVLGANWADVIINYCARCTLRQSGFCGLLIATCVNVVFGLTPWVDNFMHMGGLVAGVMIGLVLMAKKTVSAQTGLARRTQCQEAIVLVSVVIVM